MGLKELTLENICEGRAAQIFEREKKKILENIADPSTDPKKPRKITMEVIFTPNKERDALEVVARGKSNLQPLSDIEGQSIKISYAKGLRRPEAFVLENVDENGVDHDNLIDLEAVR